MSRQIRWILIGMMLFVLSVVVGHYTPSVSAQGTVRCNSRIDTARTATTQTYSDNTTHCFVVNDLGNPQYFAVRLLIRSGNYDIYMKGGDVSSISARHRLNVNPLAEDSPRYAIFRPPFDAYTIAVVPRSGDGTFALFTDTAAPGTANRVSAATQRNQGRRIQTVTDYGSFELEAVENAQFQIPFYLACPGEIKVELTWSGADFLYVVIWSPITQDFNPGIVSLGGNQSHTYTTQPYEVTPEPWRIVIINARGIATQISNLRVTTPDHTDCVQGYFEEGFSYLRTNGVPADDSFLPGDEIVAAELVEQHASGGTLRVWYTYNTSDPVPHYIGINILQNGNPLPFGHRPIEARSEGWGDITFDVVANSAAANLTSDQLEITMYMDNSPFHYSQRYIPFNYNWVRP